MGIYLYGAGGHGKVVLDILFQQKKNVIAFVDDDPKTDAIHDVPVFNAADILPKIGAASRWIVTIGDNSVRRKIAEKLEKKGYAFESAIHPSAQLAVGVTVGSGTVVMANAVLNTDTHIGQHTIINTAATIDHDCLIGDYCHIAPGSLLCGEVVLGAEVFLGVGSKVCPRVSIGDKAVCGAGAVVLNSLPERCVAYGCPAKIIRLEAPSLE